MDADLLGLGTQFEQSLTSAAVQFGIQRLKSLFRPKGGAIERAAAATAAQFPHIPGAANSISEWTQSDEFISILERFVSGERGLTHAEVLDSFIAGGTFFFSEVEERQKIATEVLTAFFRLLNTEFLTSEEGLAFHAARTEFQYQSLLTEIRQSQSRHLAKPENDRVGQSVGEGEPEPIDPSAIEVEAQLDVARDLLDSHRVVSARSVLTQIKESHTALSPNASFRLKTNLAYCELIEGESDAASRLFEQAAHALPDSDLALANHALAALLRREHDTAIQRAKRAIAVNSRNPRANGILLQALSETNNADEFEKLISSSPWMLEDAYCAAIIAEIRSSQRKWSEAICLLQSAIGAKRDDPDLHLLLASIFVVSAQEKISAGAATVDLKDQLVEAKGIATNCIDLLSESELHETVQAALVIRAQANTILGLIQSAISDLNEVLSQVPEHPAANSTKGLILVDSGRAHEAAPYLIKGGNFETDSDVRIALAEAQLSAERPDQVISLLEDKVNFEKPNWDDVRKAELLAKAKLQQSDAGSTIRSIALSLREHPENTCLMAMAAICKVALADESAALRWANRAIAKSSSVDRKRIAMLAGSIHRKQSRYREAADEYAIAVDGDPMHVLAVDLLICLVHSRRYHEAFQWVDQICDNVLQPAREVLEVKAKLFEYVGDMRAAIRSWRALCAHIDADALDSVHLVTAHIRAGEYDKAREIAKRVEVAAFESLPSELVRFAHLQRFLGIENYLEFAYQGRIQGRHDASAHMGYFSLIASENESISTPSEVSVGTVVKLSVGGVEEWWQVSDTNEATGVLRELQPDDELARALSGKQVGECISIPRGDETVEYEIIEIQSKYVRAFQETAAEFKTRFPSDMRIQGVEIVGDDFSKLLSMAAAQSRSAEAIAAVYEEGQLPFTTFCAHIGKPVAQVWKEFVTAGTLSIQFADGTESEADAAKAALSNTDAIVLDSLSLLIAHELGIGDALRRRFTKVCVPQQVVDEIVQTSLEARLKAPSGHLGVRAGGPMLLEVGQESWAKWRSFTESIVSFAESLERIACYPLLRESLAVEAVAALTPTGVGAAFAGYLDPELDQFVLVCDDLVLRKIAGTRETRTANTQTLLEDLQREGLISQEEYSVYVERLAGFGYRHVRVSIDDIVRSYARNNFASTVGTRALLSRLSIEGSSVEAAAMVGAGIIIRLLSDVPVNQLHLILMAIVTELNKRPDADAAIWRFKDSISARLPLGQLVARELVTTIDLFVALGSTFSTNDSP